LTKGFVFFTFSNPSDATKKNGQKREQKVVRMHTNLSDRQTSTGCLLFSSVRDIPALCIHLRCNSPNEATGEAYLKRETVKHIMLKHTVCQSQLASLIPIYIQERTSN
jgi:hypothetical protein